MKPPAATVDAPQSSAVPLIFAATTLGPGWAKLLGLPWLPVVIAAAVAACLGTAGVATRAVRRRGFPAALSSALVETGLILLVFVMRYLPLRGLPAPPGGDMAVHAWLARIAVSHAVLPATQLPIFPDLPYGVYPLGFHSLLALLAGGSGGLTAASLVMIALSHALFAGAVYRVLRSHTGPVTAAITAAATVFIQHDPQAYISWGGHPCVLGFAFAIYAWQAAREFLADPRPGRLASATVFAAATTFTHPTAALALAVALVLTVALHAAGGAALAVLRPAVLLAAISLLLVVPQIVEVQRNPFSPKEKEEARQTHMLPPQSPHPSWHLLPDYWKYIFGDGTLILAGVGLGACLAMGRRRRALWSILTLVTVPFAVTAYRHSGLPLSLALYPERVMLALTVPLAILLSQVLAAIAVLWRSRRSPLALRALTVVLVCGLVATVVVNSRDYYFRRIPGGAIVTEPVLAAFAAIEAAATPDAVVANTTGDAATFLPALTGIAVTHPHLSGVWADELEVWRARQKPTFFYVQQPRRPDSTAAGVPHNAMLLTGFVAGGDTTTVWKLP